jgi:uncharacterized protein (TIGR00297 family)
MSLWVQILAQVFSIAVGLLSYKKKSVSISGLIALLFISSVFIWLNQISLLLILFYMFASSSFLTHFGKSQKSALYIVEAKSGPRDYVQAIANLGIATVLICIYQYNTHPAILTAIMGSVAAANADSWSSEIGGLSKGKVYLITTLRTVQKGISGGVTLVGTIGGIAGSLFISAAAIATLSWMSSYIANWSLLFIASFLAGVFGFILDSYLGAIFQSLYINKTNQRFTEKAERNSELVKGLVWMNNDLVNFFTTMAGAIVAGLLYYIFE